MGKNSKLKYPSYSNGVVNVNGVNRASAYKKGKTINTNYNMTDAEKGIYDYAQNSLLSSLPQVNVFSADTINDINSQLQAYQNKGIQAINDIYSPILTNTKDDIASRFGNLNNSIFFDRLNKIENNRSNAINALAQDLLAQKSTLYNNELANRYNYLNFMNDLQNQINNNALSYMGLAQNNSNAGNAYNQNAYTNNMNTWLQLAQLAQKFYTK